jgi:hypothetical protein
MHLNVCKVDAFGELRPCVLIGLQKPGLVVEVSRAHTHTYTHVHTHTQTHTHIHTCTHTYTHAHTGTYRNACACTHVCNAPFTPRMYKYTHTMTRSRKHARIPHTHTLTHAHTQHTLTVFSDKMRPPPLEYRHVVSYLKRVEAGGPVVRTGEELEDSSPPGSPKQQGGCASVS